MRYVTKIVLVLVVGGALVLIRGYWYALNHASLHLRVDDYGLKSPSRVYDTPHGVSLVLRDAANGQLAVARSVEPLGYILAVHPDSDVGNCEHRVCALRPVKARRWTTRRATRDIRRGPQPGHIAFAARMSPSAPARCGGYR